MLRYMQNKEQAIQQQYIQQEKTTISLSHCASKAFRIKRHQGHTKARSYIPTAFGEN